MIAFTGADLLAWLEETSSRWKRLIEAHPEVLGFPCDVRESKTVRELLQHIVAVELRYTERLCDLPETPYEAIAMDTPEALYATHDRAMALVRPLLGREDQFWDAAFAVRTRSAGVLRTTRRTVLAHLMTHSIRHYAQLATLVRQHGVRPDWPMDYIFMHASPEAAEQAR